MHLSEAEWQVMNAIWKGSPASAREILERVEGERGWSYSTVKTLLSRLVMKGALRERKRANTSLYEPLVERGKARRAEVRALLARAFDGAFGSLLHHLAAEEKLSPRDRRALEDLLARDEEEKKP